MHRFQHWVPTLLSLTGLWTPEDWIHTLLFSVFSAPNMVDSTNIFAFLLFHIPWEAITLGVLNEWHRERAWPMKGEPKLLWVEVVNGICHSLFFLTCLSLCEDAGMEMSEDRSRGWHRGLLLSREPTCSVLLEARRKFYCFSSWGFLNAAKPQAHSKMQEPNMNLKKKRYWKMPKKEAALVGSRIRTGARS